MIADPWAAPDASQPEIEEPGFAQTRENTHAMDDECEGDHPCRAEDQEQLGRNHRVGDKPGVGDAGEHLRARQRHEHRVALKPVQRSVTKGGGRLDACDDARRAEQNEAAEDYSRAIAPVDPASQHHEADCGDGDHRDNRRDSAE